jgi:hypothetical protein
MTRSRQSRKWDELSARCEAEDRAVEYLSKLPPKVALATALSVERALAIWWQGEQSEMIRRGDPREVFPISPRDMQNLQGALAAIPPDVKSDGATELRVIALLACLPPDQAWLIAHIVAVWEAAQNGSPRQM